MPQSVPNPAGEFQTGWNHGKVSPEGNAPDGGRISKRVPARNQNNRLRAGTFSTQTDSRSGERPADKESAIRCSVLALSREETPVGRKLVQDATVILAPSILFGLPIRGIHEGAVGIESFRPRAHHTTVSAGTTRTFRFHHQWACW